MSSLLYLFRHGHAAPPGLLIGRHDIGLSTEGKAQFHCWRELLAGQAFAAAWCSPLLRARQSADILLEGNAGGLLQAGVLDALNEISLGLWEGKSKDWVTENFAKDWEARGHDMAHTAPPGGESFHALALRVLPAFRLLCGEAARHPLSFVVAHQAVNRVILASLSGLGLDRVQEIPQPPACLNILALASGGKARLVGQQFPPR